MWNKRLRRTGMGNRPTWSAGAVPPALRRFTEQLGEYYESYSTQEGRNP